MYSIYSLMCSVYVFYTLHDLSTFLSSCLRKLEVREEKHSESTEREVMITGFNEIKTPHHCVSLSPHLFEGMYEIISECAHSINIKTRNYN